MQTETLNFREKIYEIRNIILVDKKPLEGLKILDNILLDAPEKYLHFIKKTKALAYLENKNYKKASEIYQELNDFYQVGFCNLLEGNLEEAKNIWESLPDSAAKNWGLALIGFINVDIKVLPTYLQVRNHLEVDLDYLFKADKIDYVENVLRCCDVLFQINAESYKFLGRVLMNNEIYNIAFKFFTKSQKIIPQDPEIYFHMGQCSIGEGYYDKAKTFLKKCIDLNPNHYPAEQLLRNIKHK